ncbi:hypothetical protein CDV31_016491 [Fusarium ambrosium]|uniref:Uncharacterized protein n=1 Tax=Fusarium ambrosium TaxID=131363 RepID=A0A428S7P8_9HYPO|nr:hypothetical protein CDV31_016491 [Fusarium ambrosium]
MAFTPTHPLDAWSPSHMTIAEFQSALTDACRNYYGDVSRNRLYDKMRVLAVHWEVDETWEHGLDVWYSLRNHPAISFMGFEMNPNRAMQNNPVLQAVQSNASFNTTSKGSSAGNQKENQLLK